MNSQSPLVIQDGQELRITETGELLLVIRIKLPTRFRADSMGGKFSPETLARLRELSVNGGPGVAERAGLIDYRVRTGEVMEAARRYNTTWEVLHRLERGILEHGADWLLRYKDRPLKARKP